MRLRMVNCLLTVSPASLLHQLMMLAQLNQTCRPSRSSVKMQVGGQVGTISPCPQLQAR